MYGWGDRYHGQRSEGPVVAGRAPAIHQGVAEGAEEGQGPLSAPGDDGVVPGSAGDWTEAEPTASSTVMTAHMGVGAAAGGCVDDRLQRSLPY